MTLNVNELNASVKDMDFTLGQKQQLTSAYKSCFQNMIQKSWEYKDGKNIPHKH